MYGLLFSLNVIFAALKNENEEIYNHIVFYTAYSLFC